MDRDQPHPRPADQDQSSAAADLASYAAAVRIIENLPLLVWHKRHVEHLSLRAAATASGVGYKSMQRCEDGERIGSDILLALVRWVCGFPQAATTPPGGGAGNGAGNGRGTTN